MKFKHFGWLIAFCLTLTNASAQRKYEHFLSLLYESGPMLSNGTDWGDEVKNAVEYKALDFRLGWKKINTDTYSYLYRNPRFGLGLNFTIPYFEEIGQPYAIYGFMDVPFSRVNLPKRFQTGYFSQFGVGFNVNPYNPNKNPVNQYLGSKINAFVHLGFWAKYPISPSVDFQASLGLKHLSNGASKKPNAGINLVPFSVGVKYRLGSQSEIQSDKFEIPEFKPSSHWNFALYSGMKNYELGAPVYFRGGLGVNYLIQPSYKYRVGLGMDLFYAQGLYSRFPDLKSTFKNQTSLGLVASWEWQLTENLYVPIGFGAYLYRQEHNQEVTWYYERIGLRYRFSNQLFLGLQIKAHRASADFFEFTLGYTISK
ncbi:acyloxyacyl hydrolase [Algoriphagus sanaruensis]|uniref:Deacylase n=1 Tax=Algoriphagus sanaruensis TaxID=1727163 RepID=A0A142EP04_9BACT|nr:acyloxyacyl hydrolase [Algoriphagus sanaruensis]AMQ56859.1 hypothetical protein AO498_10505 [Algoriphagus sanaruensis]